MSGGATSIRGSNVSDKEAAARRAAEAAQRAAEEAARKAAEAARQAAAAQAQQAAEAARKSNTAFECMPRNARFDERLGTESPATSLLTEDTKDGQVNCLDYAADWSNKATPELRAKSDMVFMKDTRAGKEGESGHVVIRQGEKVFDPTTNKSYESMDAFKKAQPHYQEAGAISATNVKRILDTKPGSPERAAALDKAKVPAELQEMMVADDSPEAAAEREAWAKYDKHLNDGPPNGADIHNGAILQDLRAAYTAKSEELSKAAGVATADRLKKELSAKPGGAATVDQLNKLCVPIQILDDKDYANLPGATQTGHTSLEKGPIFLPRSQATTENFAKLAYVFTPPALPTTPEDGVRVATSIQHRVEATLDKPLEFSDSGINIVAMKNPKPYVVDAGPLGFKKAAKDEGDDPGSDTIINTNFFKITGTPVGQVWKDGKKIAGTDDKEGFYAAWTPDGMRFGKGNPPSNSTVGFGGAIPVMIDGMPYGDGNKYKPGTPGDAPLEGEPGDYASSMTQKNNKGFISQDGFGATSGKSILGYDRDTGMTYVVVQQNGVSPGKTLSEIRDALARLGVDDAVAFDGSDSAALVRDEEVIANPGDRKNLTIPYGLGLSLS